MLFYVFLSLCRSVGRRGFSAPLILDFLFDSLLGFLVILQEVIDRSDALTKPFALIGEPASAFLDDSVIDSKLG